MGESRDLHGHFRYVIHPANLWRLCLLIDDWIAFSVGNGALRSDAERPALALPLGQLNELLGVLRGIEQRRELANRIPPPIICSVFFSTSSSHSASGTGSTPPGAFTFLRVPLVRFLASACATSRVIPNTANVLIASLQSGSVLRPPSSVLDAAAW